MQEKRGRRCGVETEFPFGGVMAWQGIVAEYKSFLPISEKTPIVSLHEGNTPLIYARNLAKFLGCPFELYLKFEGLNPTGSFKDRGMTLAISKAQEEGARAVVCASTGNTSASAAAYAARAGMKAFVLIPDGKIALGKLAQAVIHGAEVLQIAGNFDEALEIVRVLSEKYPMTLVNSLNPFRIEGQKTAAFEICDVLKTAPDLHFLPLGNAGNITAYWKGYREYHSAGNAHHLPKMYGIQAEGAAPFLAGKPIANPETIATAIRIGNPASWDGAMAAKKESGGRFEAVSDEEILAAYQTIARTEGVFCEPASAASVAGLMKVLKAKELPTARVVVCTLTGHGLKDPDSACRISSLPTKLEAKLSAVEKQIEKML
ncbi:MAG: threonine synthase [Cystobacterineae bacterium]|nr:threonine synthase [Cystobacterineae bacterium]